MIEKEIKYIKICGTVKYELPLDKDMRFPPTNSAFSCLIPALGVWFTGHVIQEEDEKQETEETDSAPTSDDKDIIGKLYAAIHRLEDRHENLKEAFETECKESEDAINRAFKDIEIVSNNVYQTKRDVSDLQQAFVKYAICKKTDIPQGEEPMPKQSWINKMNQRMQAVENTVDKRCNKLHQRLQKLESSVNKKEELTAAEHIERGKFVYRDSNRKVRECKERVPPSEIAEQTVLHTVLVNVSTMTAMEDSTPLAPQQPIEGRILKGAELKESYKKGWLYKKKEIPLSGGSVQANDPKIMTIEEAEKQRNELISKNDELVSKPWWNLGTHHNIAKNINKICELEEWIENQKNTKPPEEPDIIEQIKAGENRLWELRKSADCVTAIANSASETVSLKEHVIKLMSIHTGLNITGIRMCNKTYKIHYNCKEKGIYVELT